MKFRLLIFLIGITGFFSSCEEILFEQNISDQYLEIVTPIDSSIVSSNIVTFKWLPIEGATSYEIQIVKPDFSQINQFLVDEIIEETKYEVELLKGVYSWRVRAFNSGYSTDFTSANFLKKDPEDFSDYRVSLVAPINNLITKNLQHTLKWEPIAEAESYRIQIISAEGIIEEYTTEDTQQEVVFAEGRNQWKVRAETNTQNTLYSTRVILTDTLPPFKAELSRPLDDSRLSSTVVNFEWKRENREGSDEFDSLYVYKDNEMDSLYLKDQLSSPGNVTLEREGIYYWKVKSFDVAGNSSNSAEVFSFRID